MYFFFSFPVDVQKQNNLCCKAGAKMQRKNGHLAGVRKAKAQLISKKRESEQKKRGEGGREMLQGEQVWGLRKDNY